MGNKIPASRSLAIVQGEGEVTKGWQVGEVGRTRHKAQVTVLYC